jgi:hypothetical protein
MVGHEIRMQMHGLGRHRAPFAVRLDGNSEDAGCFRKKLASGDEGAVKRE